MKRDCLHYSLVLFFPWSWSVVSSSPTPHRHPLVSSRASQPSRPTRLTNHQHVLRQPQTVVRPINMSIGKPAPIISFKERRSLFGQPPTCLTLTLLSPPTNISMAQCPSLVFNLRPRLPTPRPVLYSPINICSTLQHVHWKALAIVPLLFGPITPPGEQTTGRQHHSNYNDTTSTTITTTSTTSTTLLSISNYFGFHTFENHIRG